MQIQVQTFTVHQRIPLRTHQGITGETTNIWIRIEDEGIEGWGEASPIALGEGRQSTQTIARSLQKMAFLLRSLSPLERQRIDRMLVETQVPAAARAAVDIALQDWLGKRVGLPLWQVWGLDRDRICPNAVTIGISSPEAAQERVKAWLGRGTVNSPRREIHALKVKLGSPAGIAADQAMFVAVRTAAPQITQVSVDADGGWAVQDAIEMSYWLAEQGVSYLEQPIAKGYKDELSQLYRTSPVPIFVDEGCNTPEDIVSLGDRVHGITINLMRCGGLSEARRMIHTAQSYGLKILLNCSSDSTLTNTAAAHLAPLANYLNLDSHLNLVDDPFVGAPFQDGYLLPPTSPGLGVILRSASASLKP